MEKNNKNELIKIERKRKSISENTLKILTYILTVIFVFVALGLSVFEKETVAENNFNNPTTTSFATIDYQPGDGAQLNTSTNDRFKKTFESYRMKDVNSNTIKIRKIEHKGSAKKAVYCIDRTTEFPGTTDMTYHYNGTLNGNYLEIPQYTYSSGNRDIIKHKISGDQLGQLRWLVDQFYIRETGSLETKQAIKKNLFEKTAAYKLRSDGKNPNYNQIKKESEKYYNLVNDSDLESLQQWVLWDIANEKIDKTKYVPYNGGLLYYTSRTPAGTTEIPFMGARKDIYEYLYKTAKTKNQNYKNEVETPQIGGQPKSEQVSKQESGLNTIGIINYGYSVAIPGDSENKSAITKIELFNGRGQLIDPKEYKVGLYGGEKPTKQDREIAKSLKLTLQDVVGEGNFFIYFPDGSKYFDENEKFKLKATFRKIVTHPFVYLPDEKYIQGNARITQSVVMLDRDEKEVSQSMEVDAPKGFDLALRKSIIKITNPDGDEVRTFNERIPKVDTSNLKTTSMGAEKENMTAKYYHPKNPIDVEPGSIITYEFNVYNEDDQDKDLNEILDFLPKGLRMVPLDKSTINKEAGWEELNGGKVLKLSFKDKNISLKGATKGTNSANINGKAKFHVELYVEDTAEEGRILTNISEINKADPQNDRDSKPGNHSETYFSKLSEEKLEKYKGNDQNKDDLSDKNYFYKGQEDDDDFEKVRVVVPKVDLALKKFVDTVNSKKLEVSREPKVDTTQLKNKGLDAKYTFPDPKENKVAVRKDDIIEYTIRVYNEGEIDAYAAEIDDLIPQGTVFLKDHETNKKYGWQVDPNNSARIFTDYLSKEKETNPGENLLKRFKMQNSELDYKDIKVVVQVTDTSDPKKLINISEITKETDKKGKPREDRDSKPGNHEPKEDDQDYEHLIGKEFDLALRKYITHIKGKAVSPSRKPNVDTSPLKNGTGTTAIYKHPKNPLEVEDGDIVRYSIIVFNEGDISGYAKEITDNLPNKLQFIPNSEINIKYGWKVDETNKQKITTDYLSKEQETKTGRNNLLKAFNKKTDELDFRILEIEARVVLEQKKKVQENTINEDNKEKQENKENIENTEKEEQQGNNQENNLSEDNPVEGEKINLNSALIDDKDLLEEVTENEGKLKYDASNIKAEEIKKEENKQVENKVEQKNTENKENEEKVQEKQQEKEKKQEEKIKTGLSKEELEFVQLESDNTFRNIAEISEDEDEFGKEIEDRDSDPHRKTYENNPEGSWEDDEDFEKLKIREQKIFDLALIKLVTGYELKIGNKTKKVNTHHTRANNNPEPVVKIDLDESKIKQTEIKYIYTIEITNEGELEGYATEISDYIPHGLKFEKADNPNWEEKDGKLVTTQLKDKLLKPGQRAQVKLVLRWDKKSKYFGQMTNVAEISKDKNEFNVPDKDSVPNNKKPGEDDIDDASVILSIKTGLAQTFYTLVISSLSVIGISTFSIKKRMFKNNFYM